MGIVIIRQDGKNAVWLKALKEKAPGIPLYDYREAHPHEEIKMAIVWKHPPGVLKQYPRLECIASFGAGVDFIFEDPDLPPGIPITRVVDPLLASDMSEFVLAQILSYLKNLKQFALKQEQHLWNPLPYRRLSDLSVGIMGVGALGKALAGDLLKLSVQVRGWSASGKPGLPFPVHTGTTGLQAFLKHTNVLVCLLPLTPETRRILNTKLFSALPRGAFVINVARGGHLAEEDLLQALNSGHLSGAALDVFNEEPLPEEHPFWDHPRIHISPHIASVSDLGSVVPQLLENYTRLIHGQPLLNQVSDSKGY